MLAILIVKVLCRIGRLIGRGSSLPGKIALKLFPKALQKLQLPHCVIAVTGSNGKTGTCGLITKTAEASGKKVLSNREGSNQKEGIATLLLENASLFTKKVDADVIVLESDERFCQYTFKDITPDYMVITNLFRDQLTRNGHSEFVKGELSKGIPVETRLILNANEPISSSLGWGREDNIYYGVSAPEFNEKPGQLHAYDDGAVCPVCRAKMEYTSRIAGQVGVFHCTSCGFGSGEMAHCVTGIKEDGTFLVDDTYSVMPQLKNTYSAQNIAAVFTVCTEAIGLSPEETAKHLSGLALHNKRTVFFNLGGNNGTYILCKHENSMGYNAGIETAVGSSVSEMTVVFIVDKLSRKYVANDMSWLWDIDFERLTDDRVKRVVVSGGFAHDLACRAMCAGIDEKRLVILPDPDDMMEDLRNNSVGDIYVFTCFTDQGKFFTRLRDSEVINI